MKLIIVESPTKAKTLGKFLPKEYEVMASMGHVRDLPKSKMGVDPEKDFAVTYEMPETKEAVVKKMQSLAKKAKEVILATDPDREGEAIAYHVAYLLTHDSEANPKSEIRNPKIKAGSKKKAKTLLTKSKLPNTIFSRVTFHEITKTAIEEALKHPGKVNTDLVDAQQARRVVDRLVGYSLSPVLWKKVRRGLSAGRVQSVALKMIVEREKEIGAFKPQENWAIKVLVAPDKKNEFWIELFEVNKQKIAVKGEKAGGSDKALTFLDGKGAVEPVVAGLKSAVYAVESVDKKERKKSPYPPYTTSTLQQAAANVLGWSGKMTMRMAQDLYEKGRITYHRTDSFNLASEAVSAARAMISGQFGAKYLPEKPNFYKTNSKNAQEAHEAIRPTDPTLTDVTGDGELTEKHQKLYRLIWRRMVACQMLPAIYDQTTITVAATPTGKEHGYYRLRASGSIVKFDGWRAAYGGEREDVVLPAVEPAEKLSYKEITPEQKFTQPPPRFNDASLVKELEKKGIGRPSTYAAIISRIIDVGYVERVEKTFKPTSVGDTVSGFLQANFEQIMDYNFTAEMEEDLDRIARGEKEWQSIMKAFYKPFDKNVVDVTKNAVRVAIPTEKTGEKCPDCKEGDLVIRTGRFGRFISCSRFPECKYTAKLVQKLEGFKCPDCGKDVVLKRTKKGRTFWGCTGYPACNYASWKDPRGKDFQSQEKVKDET